MTNITDDIDDSVVEVKLVLPAALIDEYTTVFKVGGEQPFELRNKIPVFSKVQGVSISVKNEMNEPVKFLIARSIDVISDDTLLRIDYSDWREGIYEIFEQLESIAERAETFKSDYKVALILPLFYVENGTLVFLERGSKPYRVYKDKQLKDNQKMKVQISLDNQALTTLEFPVNSVLLVEADRVILKNTDDFVKIERPLSEIDDLISIVSSFIDEMESK